MRRLILFAGAAAIAACASSNQGGVASLPPDRVLVIGAEGQVIRTQNPDGSITSALAAPPDRVWAALQTAYGDLGSPPNFMDRSRMLVGLGNVALGRRLGGQPLSVYLRCGSTLTGSIADDGRVTASVISQVTADGKGGSTLGTTVTATAKLTDGSSTNESQCTSTGALEARIAASVARRLAPAP